ncbi:MAG: hypothetical protein J7J65_00660 [Candidatus Korarchaeota archaeon]|nr:hypothetical protein [Candidatus Korarchaeota archaeon]
MKTLGEVIKVTRSRNFLVKLKSLPEKDLKDRKVVSEDLTLVGVVSDIIGPVHEPYALVKILVPLDKSFEFIGKRVYLVESKKEAKLIRYPDTE